MSDDKALEGDFLTRRGALTALLGAGVAIGCSSSGTAESTSDASPSDDASAPSGAGAAEESAETGTCEATPEGEIGPYFADDSAAGFQRSDILSNLDGTATQEGVPLTLTVTVVDTTKGCAPYAGAQVDIWHCNASGVYSDIASENTASEEWLRGYQLADASGRLTFETVIPGWYQGRTTHIHLRVRSSFSEASSTTDETNTTQCFFEQAFIDDLYTSVAPYSSRGKNTTTNASDQVYSAQEAGANVLQLTGDDASGYAASVTIFLPITAMYDASAPGGGGMPPGGPDGGFPAPDDGGEPG